MSHNIGHVKQRIIQRHPWHAHTAIASMRLLSPDSSVDLVLFVAIAIAHVRCVCVVDSIGVSRQHQTAFASHPCEKLFGPSLRGRALHTQMHIAGTLRTFGQERHGA